MLKAEGRMIRVDISTSEKIAKLSPKALALFCLLIPHFNAHGKMPAGAGHIKDIVCPLIDWLPEKSIPSLLKEISLHTSVKYFKDEKGLWYLHSLSWSEHQELRPGRMGPDRLPNYSGSTPGLLQGTPGLLPPEVQGKVEGKVEGKVQGKVVVLSEPDKPDSDHPTSSIDPDIVIMLHRCPKLSILNHGNCKVFWDGIIASVETYKLGAEWLNKELIGLNGWMVSKNKGAATVQGAQRRVGFWIRRALDRIEESR